MIAVEIRYRLPISAVGFFLVLALLGGGALVAGLFQAPERTCGELLVAGNYLMSLGLGALVFLALLLVTGARWSDAVRRVPEAITAILPVAALALGAVLLFRPALYSWTTPGPHKSASALQELWLNRPFFLIRSSIYVVLWMAFAFLFVRNSRRQDKEHDPEATTRNLRLSAAFLVVFGVTCWLASYDWIMSLEPQWASTIFGVYNFAGLFLSGLAAIILLVIWLRGHSPLGSTVSEDHLHDLGTLLFAFSSFWMYTWFCQYLLIWFVNKPDETSYLRQRWHGNWPALMFLDLALNWGIPFFVLLWRAAKRNPRILAAVAAIVLIGRWTDLALMILPSQGDERWTPGVIEAGLLLGTTALFVLIVFRSLGQASLAPCRASGG